MGSMSIMYTRIYNNKLIRVYTGDDLNNSELISKLKGRDLAGFTIRDKYNNITFYDIEKVSSKELQLVIRNLKTTTIAINMSEEEIIDYFYIIAKVQLIENNRELFKESELYEWMNSSIDSGIVHSEVWNEVKDKVYLRLLKSGFTVIDSATIPLKETVNIGNRMNTPVANKIPKKLIKHNHERIDNYYWLNDREDKEVIAYLNAENTYTKSILEYTEDLQKELFEEITSKIVKDEASVPYKINGYWYYTRYEEGKDYPFYCRKKESIENEEIILLNVNELAEGHAYYTVGGLSISPDNKMLCFGVDSVSRRIYTLHFKNLETNEILSETIKQTTGVATWASDSKTIFYTQKDDATLRSHKIFRYELGSLSDLEYSIEHHEDRFYVLTNLDAKNFYNVFFIEPFILRYKGLTHPI